MLTLDVWSDIACPWCYIGKRRLERALADEPPGSVDVRWHAFLLQPDIPAGGLDAREYYTRKFGSAEEVAQLFGRVTDEAAKEGLELRYDLIRVAPNTLLAHRAVKLSADPGAAVDALFAAHFQRGVDVGDRNAIVEVLQQAGAGLDVEALDGGGAVEDVTADLRAAQEIGISGVPFWVAGGRVALSGAHEPALLRKLLEAGREQGG